MSRRRWSPEELARAERELDLYVGGSKTPLERRDEAASLIERLVCLAVALFTPFVMLLAGGLESHRVWEWALGIGFGVLPVAMMIAGFWRFARWVVTGR